MTIHNAKGLEFDTVILPHLERHPSHDDTQLLLWMEHQREEDIRDLIIAPLRETGEKNDLIYDYIKYQGKKKSYFENGRLLYVATTRAKSKLHLLFSVEANKKNEFKPQANSLLQQLWPAIETQIKEKNLDTNQFVSEKMSPHNQERSIKRLVSRWENPIKAYQSSAFSYHQPSAGFKLPLTSPKIIGTVTHVLLQQLACHGISWWNTQKNHQKNNYLKSQLIQAGLLLTELPNAIEIISQGMHTILQDERGQWLLHSHKEAQSEFSLTALINNEVKSIIIDRTFIDEKETRWIIDYKTTLFSNTDLDNFLRDEQKKYAEQLWHYHQALQLIDSRPIRVGLYFPLIPAWKEWNF